MLLTEISQYNKIRKLALKIIIFITILIQIFTLFQSELNRCLINKRKITLTK